MNAIANAFRANGIVPIEERLRAAARDAVDAHPRDFEKATEAFLGVVTRDLAMMVALTRNVIKQPAQMYLHQATQAKRREEQKPVEGSWTKGDIGKAGGRGQVANAGDGHMNAAPAARAEVSGGGQLTIAGSSGHRSIASPSRAKPAYVRPTSADRAEQQRRANIAVAEVRSRALLDRVYPGMEKPLAEMTLEELRPWATRYSEHGRFISLVISNMTAPTQRVGDCYNDDADLRTYEALARQAVRAEAEQPEAVH